MVQLTWRNGLDSSEADEIMALLTHAEKIDGVAPVGEHVILRLTARRGVAEQIEPVQADVGGSEHYIVRGSRSELVGYAHLDTAAESGPLVAELAVHPDHRRLGIGTRLVQALVERVEIAEDSGTDSGSLRIWSHGEHPGALRLAERYGLHRVRELWRMGRMLQETDTDAPALPDVVTPEGVTIRAFRTGVDEAEVVRVNHRAFSWHPEQGDMSEEDLRRKEFEDWFDAAGFLLAVDEADRLLGFHWTKIHPDGAGEVYVVGVDPDTQGSGLGRALTAAGLQYLRDVGCTQVMLYVEGDNGPAIAVYRRLGFERWDTDVQFGL
ncbi:mycothiol synthase [Allosaccharopolyspora coralli]|uniref:mycothiol synthase n=1 Tax=Allosaccharopolyspora coralli TaxID=2665642 RepID=UPI001E441270|nr:mycothiol synthase [Allosaccharopolyspora coralli]